MTETKLSKLRITGQSHNGITTTVKVRNLPEFFVDESERMGGDNKGPNPLEYLLGSLAGCTSIIAYYVSEQQGFSYSGLSFTVEGTFDPRGFAGEDDIRTYFQEVTLVNHIETDETDEAIEKLAAEVERRCPVYNLMLDAGIDMSTQWIRTN
ncbi:MAG: OsmC family protein [Trichococcus flocculiformis]|jgi:uncharacterized OsmC-like protein